MLNGSQARFYHLNLYAEDFCKPGEANFEDPDRRCTRSAPRADSCPRGGASKRHSLPVDLICRSFGKHCHSDGPFNLLLAPAESADVVIDFNHVPAGTSFILYADAPAPFPGGDSRNDYFTGDPDQTAIGGAPSTSQGLDRTPAPL